MRRDYVAHFWQVVASARQETQKNAAEYTNSKVEELRKTLGEQPSRSDFDELKRGHDKLCTSHRELSASIATMKQAKDGGNAPATDLFNVRDQSSGQVWREDTDTGIPSTPVRDRNLDQLSQGLQLHNGSDSESSWTEPEVEERNPFGSGPGTKADMLQGVDGLTQHVGLGLKTNDVEYRMDQIPVHRGDEELSDQAHDGVLVRTKRAVSRPKLSITHGQTKDSLQRLREGVWRVAQVVLLSIVISLLVSAETYMLDRARKNISDRPIWEASKKPWSVRPAYTWLSNGTRVLYLGVSIAVLVIHG